jgi:cytosine/adenosine deaminase-related metal-dependent hydrolase
MGLSVWCRERVFAVVQRGAPPTDTEWDSLIALFEQRSHGVVRVLVEAQGAGPNAKQRKQLSEVGRTLNYRAAILTDSVVVRSMITAMSWLGMPHQAFALGDHVAASDYLELSPQERALLLAELPGLRTSAMQRASAASAR